MEEAQAETRQAVRNTRARHSARSEVIGSQMRSPYSRSGPSQERDGQGNVWVKIGMMKSYLR